MSDDLRDTAAAVSSYRQLAEIYQDVLSCERLDQVLERLVNTVRHLIPVASMLIAEAQTDQRLLVPLVAEGSWPEGFIDSKLPFGEGLIGLAAARARPILCNEAHLDSRAGHVAGTPVGEPEAIISVPLVARGVVMGAMSLYREGEGACFSEFDFELAQRFADAATIAIENARTREELRELGRRDELTGLLNRRGFNELLRDALADAPERPVALVLLDLDGFKNVNDLHGHVTGDEVLVSVARTVERVAGCDDAVCRVGGDEFAIVLRNTTAARAALVGATLQDALADLSVQVPEGEVRQRGSIGVAGTDTLPEPEAERLLREADRQMYISKRTDEPVTLRLVAEPTA